MRALPLLLLLLSAACQTGPSQGIEQYALSISLTRAETVLAAGDREFTEGLARRCAADIAGPTGFRQQLGQIAGEALGRARVRARSLSGEQRSEALAALSTIDRGQIQFTWHDAGFDGAPLVGGRISRVERVAKGALLPELGPGKIIHVEVRAQIVAQAPEVISARASITWWSQQASVQILAESLAAVLAERMALHIESCARAEGLVTRRAAGR